jgi:hypothetical protein
MRKYIRKLQSKPKDYRKKVMVVAMCISMVLVVSVWVYDLSDDSKDVSKDQVSDSVKPFKLFGNSISSAYQNITASVGNISSIKKQVDDGQKQVELIPVEKNN